VRTDRIVALLAPVPKHHLDSGLIVCKREGKVAFGSEATGAFLKLEELRGGHPVDVFICATHNAERPALQASWKARYIGIVSSNAGAHPNRRQLRPPTCVDEKWTFYWEVDELEELQSREWIPTGNFVGYGRKKSYPANFIPEGPIVIKHPGKQAR